MACNDEVGIQLYNNKLFTKDDYNIIEKINCKCKQKQWFYVYGSVYASKTSRIVQVMSVTSWRKQRFPGQIKRGKGSYSSESFAFYFELDKVQVSTPERQTAGCSLAAFQTAKDNKGLARIFYSCQGKYNFDSHWPANSRVTKLISWGRGRGGVVKEVTCRLRDLVFDWPSTRSYRVIRGGPVDY